MLYRRWLLVHFGMPKMFHKLVCFQVKISNLIALLLIVKSLNVLKYFTNSLCLKLMKDKKELEQEKLETHSPTDLNTGLRI